MISIVRAAWFTTAMMLNHEYAADFTGERAELCRPAVSKAGGPSRYQKGDFLAGA